MEIKDIVEREKHKRTLAKIKKREDTIARKQFLKDCYKFWKEYKKVESPYFWWLDLLFSYDIVLGKKKFFYWVKLELPKDYLENSWLREKWTIRIQNSEIGIIRNSDPQKYLYHYYRRLKYVKFYYSFYRKSVGYYRNRFHDTCICDILFTSADYG